MTNEQHRDGLPARRLGQRGEQQLLEVTSVGHVEGGPRRANAVPPSGSTSAFTRDGAAARNLRRPVLAAIVHAPPAEQLGNYYSY
jgi:hypothetical protein